MMLPSNNRTYETFWRQAGRWLAAGAPEPIALTLPSPAAGSTGRLDLDVRDAGFRALPDVTVLMHMVDSTGARRDLQPIADPTVAGRHSASFRADHSGLFRVEAEVRRGTQRLGAVHDWMLVGGADRELTDPRLNTEVLRRLATDSGGALLAANEAGSVVAASRAVRGASRRRAAARAATVAHTVGVPADHRHPVGGMGPAPPMGVAMRRGVRRVLAACVIGMVVLPGVSAVASAAERYVMIVSGAAGSAELAEQHAAWRTALVTALQDKLQMPPERLIVLIDKSTPTGAPGAPGASAAKPAHARATVSHGDGWGAGAARVARDARRRGAGFGQGPGRVRDPADSAAAAPPPASAADPARTARRSTSARFPRRATTCAPR